MKKIFLSEKEKLNRGNGTEEPSEVDLSTPGGCRENGLFLFELCKEGLKERYGVDYDEVRGSGAGGPTSAVEGKEKRLRPILRNFPHFCVRSWNTNWPSSWARDSPITSSSCGILSIGRGLKAYR